MLKCCYSRRMTEPTASPPLHASPLLRSRGWTNAALGRRWGVGPTYVSWLLNSPAERPLVYGDAIHGLSITGDLPAAPAAEAPGADMGSVLEVDSPETLRSLLRRLGWRNADLAARWGHSTSYISWLVNRPGERPPVYRDAFRGLPERSAVEVRLQPRHLPKPRRKRWGPRKMYPLDRVFVVLDSRLGPEEGTELAVRSVTRRAGQTAAEFVVTFEVLGGPSPAEQMSLVHGQQTDLLADTGMSKAERLERA